MNGSNRARNSGYSRMNFLIIRFSSLGDVVMATAVVEALHRSMPGARIDFLTKSAYTGVFEDDPRIGRVWEYEGHMTPSRLAAMISQESYDVVVDLHTSLRSRAVSWLLDVPEKRRIDKHSLARRLMILSRNKFRRSFDVTESYLAAVRPYSGGERVLPVLRPSKRGLERIETLMAEVGEPVGFAPGARHRTKCWNEEYVACVADETARRGKTPVFIGDANDVPIVNRIRGMMEGQSVNLTAELDIPATVAAVSRFGALVTNDTGLMHIAGALAIPFVAVFGPTHPDLGFVPGYETGTILHAGTSCSPCSVHGEKPCRFDRRACMDDIVPSRVVDTLFKT